MKKQEEKIKEAIAKYLSLKKVIYRFDIGADINLPIGLARKSKRVHKHKRGYPDLIIVQRLIDEFGNCYAGLFLELKIDRNEVYKKRVPIKFRDTLHVKEQNDFLYKLNELGYVALYGFGLDDALEKINAYLDGDIEKIENYQAEFHKDYIDNYIK